MAKVYVAGKNLKRAQAVMDALRKDGHIIAYDWVALIEEGSTKEKAIIETQAVRDSDVLVYLWEDNQESARYEAGMAMGLKKTIIVSGKLDSFFFQIPNVHCVNSDEEIIQRIAELR
ncbi:MAG: hypothetical protein WC520_00650 [Candidatus Paceibacterota bacterium]